MVEESSNKYQDVYYRRIGNLMRQLKKMTIIIYIMVIMMALVACSQGKDADLHPGQYVLKGEDSLWNLIVNIEEDGQFMFHYSLLSSYLAVGQWDVKGDQLVLKTDDKINTYIFNIDGETLIFDKESSSEITQYPSDTILNDGDVFTLETS